MLSQHAVYACPILYQKCCHKYWPEGVDRTSVYGKFKVKMIKEEEGDKFIVRKFEVGEDTPYMAPVSRSTEPYSLYSRCSHISFL